MRRALRIGCFGALIASAFIAGVLVAQQRIPPYGKVVEAESALLHTDPEPNAIYLQKGALFQHRTHQTVIFLGDSLTEYPEWRDLLGCPVENQGIPGDTTAGVLRRIGSVPPGSTVYLMIGVNDLAKHLPLKDVEVHLAQIVRGLSGRRLIVESTLLTRASINPQVAALDAFASRLCAHDGSCRYLDLNHILAPDGSLSARNTLDGVHLTPEGYNLWATALKTDGVC